MPKRKRVILQSTWAAAREYECWFRRLYQVFFAECRSSQLFLKIDSAGWPMYSVASNTGGLNSVELGYWDAIAAYDWDNNKLTWIGPDGHWVVDDSQHETQLQIARVQTSVICIGRKVPRAIQDLIAAFARERFLS